MKSTVLLFLFAYKLVFPLFTIIADTADKPTIGSIADYWSFAGGSKFTGDRSLQAYNSGSGKPELRSGKPLLPVQQSTPTPFYIFAGQSNLGYASVSSKNNANHLEPGDSGYYAKTANARIFNIRNRTTAWEVFHAGENTAIN